MLNSHSNPDVLCEAPLPLPLQSYDALPSKILMEDEPLSNGILPGSNPFVKSEEKSGQFIEEMFVSRSLSIDHPSSERSKQSGRYCFPRLIDSKPRNDAICGSVGPSEFSLVIYCMGASVLSGSGNPRSLTQDSGFQTPYTPKNP